MNPAIVREIRERILEIMASSVTLDIARDRLNALAFEMYLQGGIDALQAEVERVRADTAAKIAAAEHEEHKP